MMKHENYSFNDENTHKYDTHHGQTSGQKSRTWLVGATCIIFAHIYLTENHYIKT